MPYFSTLYTQSGLIPDPVNSILSYNTDKWIKKKFRFSDIGLDIVWVLVNILTG